MSDRAIVRRELRRAFAEKLKVLGFAARSKWVFARGRKNGFDLVELGFSDQGYSQLCTLFFGVWLEPLEELVGPYLSPGRWFTFRCSAGSLIGKVFWGVYVARFSECSKGAEDLTRAVSEYGERYFEDRGTPERAHAALSSASLSEAVAECLTLERWAIRVVGLSYLTYGVIRSSDIHLVRSMLSSGGVAADADEAAALNRLILALQEGH